MQLIGKRVKALREECGLSQGQLAARAGFTRSQISHIEKHEGAGVQAVAVDRLAAVLHTTSNYLLGLTDDPTPLPPGWQADQARLAQLQRLVEQVAQLPWERQERIIDAMLALQEVSGVAKGLGDESAGLHPGDSSPARRS